jgi:hypothetical protein
METGRTASLMEYCLNVTVMVIVFILGKARESGMRSSLVILYLSFN